MPTSSTGIPALQCRGRKWSWAISVQEVLGRCCAPRATLGYSFCLLAASVQKQQWWKMWLKPGLPICKPEEGITHPL